MAHFGVGPETASWGCDSDFSDRICVQRFIYSLFRFCLVTYSVLDLHCVLNPNKETHVDKQCLHINRLRSFNQ